MDQTELFTVDVFQSHHGESQQKDSQDGDETAHRSPISKFPNMVSARVTRVSALGHI